MKKFISVLNNLNIDYHIRNDKGIRAKGWQKKDVKIGEFKEGKFIGIIFKEDGITINGERVVCIDIDAKIEYGNKPRDQDELLEKVVLVLGIDKYYHGIERTQSGGFHIFCTIDNDVANNLVENSIKIEYQENSKKIKKEIEIFVKSRYMITAPSIGYKATNSENDYIDFTKLKKINKDKLDSLNLLGIIEVKNNFEENVEFNTGSSSSYLKKAIDNIPEIKRFVEGEWDNHKFIEEEIMRFYITLNSENEFIKVIKDKYAPWIHVWENYPSNFIKNAKGNRKPSKDTLHFKWLKQIGALKKCSKKDKLKENMEEIFSSITSDGVIKMGDTFYLYNGKSYEFIPPLDYKRLVYSAYLEKTGKLLSREETSELTHYFEMYLHNIKEKYNLANKLKRVKKVPLAFTNGTVYIKKDGYEFLEGVWSKEDKCFIEFSIPFSKNCNLGLLTEWINTRFNTPEKRVFFELCLGDLFATEATTDVHYYFYGDAGIGKSTLSNLIGNITTEGTVDYMKLDKIKDRFSRIKTLQSPILVADEASERSIPPSEYKSTISREQDDYEQKNIQNFRGQPIAKFITFANILPNIKIDAGVKRRLCVMKVNGDIVRNDLSKAAFSELMNESQDELVHYIIAGVSRCFDIDWDISGYYKENFPNELKTAVEANDNFSFFIDFTFERGDDKEKRVISMDAFKIYNQFLTTLEGTAMQKMSLTKFGTKIKELGIDKKRVKIKGDKLTVYTGINHTDKSRNLLQNYEKSNF